MYKKSADGQWRQNFYLPPLQLTRKELIDLEERVTLHGFKDFRMWLYGEILSKVEFIKEDLPLPTDK